MLFLAQAQLYGMVTCFIFCIRFYVNLQILTKIRNFRVKIIYSGKVALIDILRRISLRLAATERKIERFQVKERKTRNKITYKHIQIIG